MRSKYIEKIGGFLLAIIFYLILFPASAFIRDFLGIEPGNAVFLIVKGLTFLIVYGFIATFVHFGLKLLNERLLEIRKEKGGRDIAAEERHEGDSGIISLTPKDQ